MKTEAILRKYWLPLTLAVLGLIFFVYGLISFISSSKQSPESLIEESKASEIASIFVDIEGSVVKPGVYEFSQDSIVQDALISAGGLSEEADREWVSKNINLAERLKDSQKIYIPKLGEKSSVSSEEGNLININNASEDLLDSLPGIGKITAEKIVSLRPYNSIDELLSKKAVSSKVFEEIKDKITAF